MSIPVPEKHHLDRRAQQIIKTLPPMDDAQLLNTPTLAALLCCSKEWLGYARSGGFGPPWVRLSNGQVRYKKSDVVKWLEERTYRNTAEYARKFEAKSRDGHAFRPEDCNHPDWAGNRVTCGRCGQTLLVRHAAEDAR